MKDATLVGMLIAAVFIGLAARSVLWAFAALFVMFWATHALSRN